MRVVMRRMLVTVTNTPRPNTPMRARLWLMGSWLFQMTLWGSRMMATSVEMEKMALAYQLYVSEMHVPGMERFQARGMGVHWKMEDAVVAMQ